MERKTILLAALAAIMLAMPGSLAQNNREQASLALNQSYDSLMQMKEAGFSAERVNDTLTEARQMFAAQSALEYAGGTPDYAVVIERTDEIARIKKQAFDVNDEIKALELFMADIESSTKEAVAGIAESANVEFGDERYDEAAAFVEKAYQKISEEQAFGTRVSVFLDAAGRNVYGFLVSNWLLLSASIAAIAIGLVLFHGELSRARLKRKIKKLELRKGVINDMIKELQREYFEFGRIAESTYSIKIEKYKEMLRDIERLKPLLREEMEKHSGALSRRGRGE